MAGGINESGLKQDRCEGQHGRNPKGSHNRWLVESVVVGYLAVSIFCGRVFPDASPLHITPRDPLPPASCVGPCVLVTPSCVSDPSACSTWQLCSLKPYFCPGLFCFSVLLLLMSK